MDGMDDSITSSTQFIPLRRPIHRNQPQNSASAVVLRQNRNTRTPRPHSIGAAIISNPKLVKGWQYYDNSPNQKNIRKYLSTVNLPSEEVKLKNDTDHNQSGGTPRNNSPYRNSSYRKGVAGCGTGEKDDGDDYVAGVEVQACVAATDSELDDDDEEDSEGGCCRQFLGIALTILASSALALSAVFVKSLPKNEYHPYSVSVWTFQGILVPSLIVYLFSLSRRKCKNKRINDFSTSRISIIIDVSTSPRKKWGKGGLVILRGVFGWVGVVLKVYSLKFMSVFDSTIITFSSPIFVALAAWFYLKERVGWVTLLTAVVVLLGVGIITKPPMFTGEKEFDKDQLIGTAMASGCMLLGVFSIIILRYIRNVHYALVTFIYGLIGTIGSLVLCYTIAEERGFQFPKNGHDWRLAGYIAGLTFVGQNLMTLALKYEQAGIFAVVRTWEIPMTCLWEFWLLKRKPDYLSIIGASIVVLGMVILTFRKWIETLPRSRKMRRWFQFLLV